MSAVSEVLKKFDELENAMRINLGKVDPSLIVDLILRQRKEKNPIYTLEVFIKPGQDTNEVRNRIVRETGMVPVFYDQGTHIVVAHRVNFDMLKMINDLEFVDRIRGSVFIIVLFAYNTVLTFSIGCLNPSSLYSMCRIFEPTLGSEFFIFKQIPCLRFKIFRRTNI